eukprot:SAG25_NODE_4283_length_848_cov_1.074766_2_plen_36_part_01
MSEYALCKLNTNMCSNELKGFTEQTVVANVMDVYWS